MAIGERIRFFRNLRGMTQKYLGQVVGFPEKTADIRMAQYESGSRTPKAELTESLAGALGVSPLALSVPDIDSYLGLMHTLFTLEDRYGLTVDKRLWFCQDIYDIQPQCDTTVCASLLELLEQVADTLP